MVRLYLPFFFLVSFFANNSLSQNLVNRTNFWYFSSSAALDFTCAPPQSIGGCQNNISEGSSTISSLAGRMLFYSNGETVWDSTNSIMLNGTGLLGDLSTVQGSIIVPNPSSPSMYYIFTAGTSIEDQGTIGVRFSEVDMTLNGGLGGVIPASKNTFLFAPNEEKLTAVRNASNTGYWVVAQEKSTNNWYAYEVTGAGVNMTPVISTTGPPARIDNSLGAKLSPDGKWLVSQGVCGSGMSSNANLAVYQFNNATGQITYAWSDCGTTGFQLEFSPNSTKLYASGINVYQYDLTAGGGTGIGPDTTAVKASKFQLNTNIREVNGGMQLAKDCKIYFSKSGGFGTPGDIGVIQNPNLQGAACNYTTNSLTLASGSIGSSQNFPNFVQSFFEYPCSDSIEVDLIASDTIICPGDSITLEASVNNLCGYTLTWNVALSGLGPHKVAPTSNTLYQVIATTATAADTAEVYIQVTPQSAGVDTSWSICNNQNYDLDSLITSSATPGGTWLDSNFNTVSMPINITSAGQNKYYYIVGSASCSDTAEFIINKTSLYDAGNDSTFTSCGTGNVDLFNYLGGSPATGGNWLSPSNNPVSMPINLAIAPSGPYKYYVGGAGCFDTATVNVSVLSSNPTFLGNDTTLCSADSVIKSFNIPNSTFLWSTGNTTSTQTIRFPNTLYWLEVTDTISGCTSRDTLTIQYDTLYSAGQDSGIDICSDTILDLFPLTSSSYTAGYWIDPSNTTISMPYSFTPTSSGVYKYIVTNGGCSDSASVLVNYGNSISVDIGKDTTLCWSDSIVLSVSNANATYQWSTGDNSSNITVNNPGGQYFVTVNDTIQGCKGSDTVNIMFNPLVEAGEDSTIFLCEVSEINLVNYLRNQSTTNGSWYNSSGNNVSMPIDANTDTYYYVVGAGECKDTAIFTLQVNSVAASFTYFPPSIYAAETVVEFFNGGSPSLNYTWTIDGSPAGSTFNLNYTFGLPQNYEVCLIASNTDCQDTVCQIIEVDEQSNLFIPNSFTPNNDGINDVFGPSITGNVTEYNFYIFNKWGEIVYETDKPNTPWNGSYNNETCKSDVYVWLLRYKIADEIKVKTLHGHVTIIK